MIRDDLLPTATALLASVREAATLSPWADHLWTTACLTDPTEMMYARDLWWAMGLLPHKGDQRLMRTDLPTAKHIVRLVRYCYAAALFDQFERVADVSDRIGYCKWKVLDAHLRQHFGMSAVTMRETVPFPMARERLLDEVVRPYRYDWQILATGFYYERAAPRLAAA